jgi:hypothetical protein
VLEYDDDGGWFRWDKDLVYLVFYVSTFKIGMS